MRSAGITMDNQETFRRNRRARRPRSGLIVIRTVITIILIVIRTTLVNIDCNCGKGHPGSSEHQG